MPGSFYASKTKTPRYPSGGQILNTYLKVMRIQYQDSINSASVYVIVLYARIRFAVPIFLSPPLP